MPASSQTDSSRASVTARPANRRLTVGSLTPSPPASCRYVTPRALSARRSAATSCPAWDMISLGSSNDPLPPKYCIVTASAQHPPIATPTEAALTVAPLQRRFTVNDTHSALNPTAVAEVFPVHAIEDFRPAIARAAGVGRSVSICGARHAMGGQQFAGHSILLDTTGFARVVGLDADRGLVEVEAGIRWPDLHDWLERAQAGRPRAWTFRQKQTGADGLSLGGCLSANIHGRGLDLPPFVSEVEAFTLIDAAGELRRCSRSENAGLFALAIGGYG